MKQFVIVAYDISDNKRRSKIAKILEKYGVRCNFSVFECILTESQANALKIRLNKIASPRMDCILYYYLCKSCIEKRDHYGPQMGLRSEIILI